MNDGRYTIPTLLYLTGVQREKLNILLQDQDLDLADFLSELVAARLEEQPAPPLAPPADSKAERAAELRQLRREMRRLHALRERMPTPPEWLTMLIRDTESEIRRLESRQHGPDAA
jgi:hypothetical protein